MTSGILPPQLQLQPQLRLPLRRSVPQPLSVALLLLLLILGAVRPASGAELLKDGGFEEWTTSSASPRPVWRGDWRARGTSTVLERAARSGAGALRLQATAKDPDSGRATLQSRKFRVKPGRVYRAAIYARSETTAPLSVQLQFSKPQPLAAETSRLSMKVTPEWQQFSLAATAPPHAMDGEFALGFERGREVVVDDASISEEIPAGPPASPVVLLPVGVGTSPTPRFEWRGEAHDAFEVAVTETEAADRGLIWRSGEQSSQLDFFAASPALPTSRTLYAYARLRNEHGWGPWSARRTPFRIETVPVTSGTLCFYDLRYTDALPPDKTWDHIHLATALQGIVNRSRPSLWLNYVQTESGDRSVDTFWLDRLREPGAWLSQKSVVPVRDLAELLSRFAGQYRGLVVWDPKVPATALVASTAAGADDLLPVRFDPAPDSLYTQLTAGAAKLPVVLDLRGKFTGSGTIPDIGRPSTGSAKCDAHLWAMEKYLKTGKCDPRRMGYYIDGWWIDHSSQSSLRQNHTITNHDFFISRRGFFWDLSPWADEAPVDDPGQPLGTDRATLCEIFRAAYDALGGKEVIHVGGFTPWAYKYTDFPGAGGQHGGVPAEWETGRILSAYNAYVDADAINLSALANASAMTHMPLPRRYAQYPAPTREELRAAGLLDDAGRPKPRTYLLHYVGDYDSAAWIGNSLAFLWEDPARGRETLPWALNSNLSERIAPFFEHAYRTRTGHDWFVSGDSGAGYINPTQLFPPRYLSGLPGGVEVWQRHCRRWYQAFDYSFTGFVIDGFSGPTTPEVESLYAPFSRNGIVAQWPADPAPARMMPGRAPALNMRRDLSGNLEDDVATVHVCAETSRTPGVPSFLTFRTILRSPTFLSQLNARLPRSRPDLDYTFCDPKTFGYLARLHLGEDNDDLAAYLFDTVPGSAAAGASIPVEIAVRNEGWNEWKSRASGTSGQECFLELCLSRGEEMTTETVRISLPRSVPPGDAVVLKTRLRLPREAGSWNVVYEMSRGGQRFSARGGLPAFSPILVAEAVSAAQTDGGDPTTDGKGLDIMTTESRPRARELGVRVGVMTPGPLNAITDVAGVRVGHTTVVEGENVRTGVTAIVPHGGNLFREKVPAGVFVFNGFGKFVGATQVQELGELETPVLLTSTLSVFRAADALLTYTMRQPGNERVRSVNPVVGETNDGELNDIRGRHVTEEHCLAAISGARPGAVEEGCVGAGTGTVSFGYKAGIGTSSRRLADADGGWTVGVLVQANYGGVLSIGGAPVGEKLKRHVMASGQFGDDAARGRKPAVTDRADGSVIVVIATDAPVDSRNLERMAARAAMGLGRTGAGGTNGSGDYALAFSTAPEARLQAEGGGPGAGAAAQGAGNFVANGNMSPLFLAVIEATEEAVYNSLFKAVTTTGCGNEVDALPLEETTAILREHGVIR